MFLKMQMTLLVVSSSTFGSVTQEFHRAAGAESEMSLINDLVNVRF
jgi:hypothetical protein